MKKSNEQIIKKENVEYTVSFCFGSQKIENLLLEYLMEKVKEEISEKERIGG